MAGYGSDQGFTDWREANGLTLPAGAPEVAVLRQRGSTYIDGTYGARFSGVPSGGVAQDRAWPRTGAQAHGQALADDVIPTAVEQASYVASFQEATAPGSLSTITSGAGQIKREKVASLETEYFEGAGASAGANATPILTQVEGLLAPFLIPEQPAVPLRIWSIG